MADISTVNIEQALKEYGDYVVQLMAKVLKDTRSLKDNIEPVVEDLTLTLNLPQYGIYVDSGRRPGAKMPPQKPIADWAKSKGLPPFRDKKGRFISYKTRAFLIARSISKKGIKPRPFLDIFYKEMDKLLKLLGPAAAEDIAYNLQIAFDDAGIGE